MVSVTIVVDIVYSSLMSSIYCYRYLILNRYTIVTVPYIARLYSALCGFRGLNCIAVAVPDMRLSCRGAGGVPGNGDRRGTGYSKNTMLDESAVGYFGVEVTRN